MYILHNIILLFLHTHSDLPWYKVFFRAMDKISDLKLDHQNEVVEPFLYGLRDHPIPTPGIDTVLSVVPRGVDAGQVSVQTLLHKATKCTCRRCLGGPVVLVVRLCLYLCVCVCVYV